MKQYLKLMRVSHYIKNSIIFIPLVFSGNLFHRELSAIKKHGFKTRFFEMRKLWYPHFMIVAERQ